MWNLWNVLRVSSSTNINEAYTACKSVTYRFAKTFYFASRFIPQSKRNACYAVYAFCRYVDDIIDVAMETGNVTREDAVVLVAQWRGDLDDLYSGNVRSHSNELQGQILLAWEDTLSRYHIPRSLPDELIEGVLMDTTITRFDTFDHLYHYCYKVASVVGLMTSEIFGYSSPTALKHAVDLGIAMQLTNILRDVGEDADRGRIYLAQEDMKEYGVSEEDILAHKFTPQVKALLQEYARRAIRYYQSAEPGIAMLDADSRITVILMSRNYRRILNVIRTMDYNVFQQRARLSLVKKLTAVPTAYIEALRMRKYHS